MTDDYIMVDWNCNDTLSPLPYMAFWYTVTAPEHLDLTLAAMVEYGSSPMEAAQRLVVRTNLRHNLHKALSLINITDTTKL